TCGTVNVSTASATAPNANTPSSRFQPSSCQPENSSTRLKVSHEARDPASTSATPTSAAATRQPVRPKRTRQRCSTNGERLASTGPSLRLHGPSTPDRRPARSAASGGHIAPPLINCFRLSSPQNSGLVPVKPCSSTSAL